MEVGESQVFNMALATLQRIDNTLRDLNQYNQEGHIQMIQKNLMILYKEIHPFLNDKEKQEFEDKWTNINKNGVRIDEGEIMTFGNDLPKYMVEFEFLCRDILHKKGLLMAKGEDKRFVI